MINGWRGWLLRGSFIISVGRYKLVLAVGTNLVDECWGFIKFKKNPNYFGRGGSVQDHRSIPD